MQLNERVLSEFSQVHLASEPVDGMGTYVQQFGERVEIGVYEGTPGAGHPRMEVAMCKATFQFPTVPEAQDFAWSFREQEEAMPV